MRPVVRPPPHTLGAARGTPPAFHSPARPCLRQQQQQQQPQQARWATYIARPKRPYSFTQLVTLSDGSTYLHRTSSPAPVHRSTKDTRNTPLWNPSSLRMRTAESDEAGKLRAFRARFGRGWDARRGTEDAVAAESAGEEAEEAEQHDSLLDLISEYGAEAAAEDGAAKAKKAATQAEREKAGKA